MSINCVGVELITENYCVADRTRTLTTARNFAECRPIFTQFFTLKSAVNW